MPYYIFIIAGFNKKIKTDYKKISIYFKLNTLYGILRSVLFVGAILLNAGGSEG